MYEHVSRSHWRRHAIFILADLIGIQISFVLSFYIRMGNLFPYDNKDYVIFATGLLAVTLIVAFSMNTYSGIMSRGHMYEFRNVLVFVTIVMICMVAVMFILKTSALFSRAIIVLTWALSVIINTVLRILAKKAIRYKSSYGENKRQLLLVTTAESIMESYRRVSNSRAGDFMNFTGIVILGNPEEEAAYPEIDMPVVAYGDEMFEYINRNVVDGILVETRAADLFSEKMMNMCMEMGVAVHQELQNTRESGNQIVERLGDTIVLTSSIKIASSRQVVMKRLMDIAGGIIGSLLTIIIMILVTPVIKIQSPGPVLFKQTRVGKGGRRFTIYKIRTMYTDAEERKKELMDQNKMQGLMFKVDNDPRIYPFGNFLRKTSLDEFPQFFNVIKGNMSLVGTRPPTLDEYEQYEYKHQKRLSIKPGITGLWQISGRSSITDFDEIVRLDAEYITGWRLLLDIKILIKTVAVVLKGGGAQ